MPLNKETKLNQTWTYLVSVTSLVSSYDTNASTLEAEKDSN